MLKSILVVLLAASVFFSAGCYEVVSLSRDEYNEVNKYDEVNVLTDTAGMVTKYRFSRGMCVVQNDTLVGTGTRMSSFGAEDGVTIAVPTARISEIDVKKLNIGETMMVAGVLVAGTVGLLFLAGAPGASGGPGGSPSPNPQ